METNVQDLIQEVDQKDLPVEINKSLTQIEGCDQKVEELLKKAYNALNKADEAKQKKANWSITGKNKQEAIESLQDATIANADAISSSYDASIELFKNQRKISKSIGYLFGLGVSNLDANRRVVKQLEEKLKDSSQGKLNEQSKEELKNIIRQLRAQRDVWLCIENLEKSKKILDEEVNKLKQLCKKEYLIQLLSDEIKIHLDEVESFINRQIRTIQIELEKYSDKINQVSLENTKLINEKFEELNANIEQKNEEQKANLQEQIQTQEEKIEEYRKEAEDKLSSELQEIQGKYVASEELETLLKRYQNLENKVYKKSIFDSIWYKGAIGIISLSALAISIFAAF